MLKLTKRGPVFHITGTMRVGDQSVRLRETTGCADKGAAEAVLRRRAKEIEDGLLYGSKAGRSHDVASAFAEYVDARPDLHRNDIERIARMGRAFGSVRLADFGSHHWSRFISKLGVYKGTPVRGSTVGRYRSTLLAALHHSNRTIGTTVPHIPSPKTGNARVRWLGRSERDTLLESYAPHAKAIATFLCFTGCRLSEALTLEWRDVSLERKTVTFRKTKNTHTRTVPLHGKVLDALGQAQPQGRVFLTNKGLPYADRQKTGSGIRTAHAAACRRAGIADFRIHDWRHHWASHMVMSGCDIRTLMELGGWRTMQMVARYAHLSVDHMRIAIERIE